MSLRETLTICRKANLLLLLQIEMKLSGRDYCTAVPGKLYNYLRSGTRILAPVQNGDTAALIRRFGAGTVVPPRDVDAIAATLASEINPWRTARLQRMQPSDALREYDRRNLTSLLVEVLQRVCQPGKKAVQWSDPECA